MSEVQKVALRELTLRDMHLGLGAVMFERDGWLTPSSYGDELLEYASVRERGAGLIDLSTRGRLLVSGSEAVAFLNGLITNDMKTLEENRWMPAVFPNVQGRLIASVRVIRSAVRPEHTNKDKQPTFVIDTEAATHERVLQTIQKFTLAGDFHVTDLTSETVMLSLQGKAAHQMIASVVDADSASISAGGVRQSVWNGDQITIIRASHIAAEGFDLIVNNAHAEKLWQELMAAGARPVGHDAWEMLRVEVGVPRYGRDMDDTTVVTETNLDEAVSYTKGCYVGQEIIARIKYRGHVAKKLRGLLFEGPITLEAPAAIISADGKEIGRVTSTTISPHLGRRIALGYLKYEYSSSGTEVKLNGHTARVVDLPFVENVSAVTD
ncbi:MAG TPA: aminomethyltransferase family protein [Pyrinomonadaceae bacterium]|nr:aminomethyltransferase family protein [Pyrinomonadaceae bacterium]